MCSSGCACKKPCVSCNCSKQKPVPLVIKKDSLLANRIYPVVWLPVESVTVSY